MNTANLQLEGVYAVLAALLDALRGKEVLSGDEIEKLLWDVENALASDSRRPAELRDANVEAIRFPARFLRVALREGAGASFSFAQTASRVGQMKP